MKKKPEADSHSKLLSSPNESAQKSPSRRAFLKGFGAAAAALPLGVLTDKARQAGVDKALPPLNIKARRGQAFRNRVTAASVDHKFPTGKQIANGDETLYPNGIANYTKGFAHDSFGEVNPTVYAAYQAATRSGSRADFDALVMGGLTPLTDPQAGLAFDLEAIDVSQSVLPPFATLTSPNLAAQTVENYWEALCRDVPVSQYATNSLTVAAAAELTSLPAFMGPRIGGAVTAQTLFRINVFNNLIGPYVSQFFLQPFNYGAIPFRGYLTDLPIANGGSDYMTDVASWLNVQNGAPSPIQSEHPDPTLRYIRSGRDLAAYVHIDVLFQEYLNAALMLSAMKAPLNAGNPYSGTNLPSKSETGFVTFGLPMVEVLVAEVMARALKHAWFQKWFVHRMARPEETGGLVHFRLTGAKTAAQYPLDPSLLNSQAVAQVFTDNGTYLLPISYPEGSPQHPSYPSGHATAAGAAVTVLKWFFDEDFVIPNPIIATDDGSGVIAYTGSDAGQLTVGGELNKLATNVGMGRNFAGIHWRQDAEQSLLLGEAVAISLLQDQKHLYSEAFTGFTFTKFDGTTITI